MKAIIIKELKLIRKDMRSFFFLLLMPVFFIIMFGTIFNNSDHVSSITIHALDQDQTASSAATLQALSDMMDVKTEPASSLNEQIDKVKKGQFSLLLVIPQGFEAAVKGGESADIKLYQDPSAQMEIAPIQAILENISNQYREQKLEDALTAMGATKAEAERTLASPIRIQNVSIASDKFNSIDQIVPGMTVMFVFFIMITMSRRFFEEKKTGLLSRIRSTSVKPLQYLFGMWIPFVLTVIVQCAVLFTFGHFIYHLHLGDLAALACIVLGLSIAGTGFGLGLSFLVPGENAAIVITQLISMGGAMVGGLWMPSFLLPKVVQNIGRFTPQYWAQHSLVDVIAHGAHIGDVIGPVAVLLAFGLAGLAVAFFRLPGYLRSAAN